MSLRLSLPSLKEQFLSQKLYVHVVRECDAAPLHLFHLDNKEHLAPWDPPYPESFFTENYWHAYCERAIQEFHDGISARYLLWFGEELVGSVNATSFEMGPFQNARIGYKVGAKFQGQGLAREGVAAVVSELFRAGFHRVEANYRPNNERSGKLLRALGFTEIGISPNYLMIDGQWRDHMLTAVTVESWKEEV